MTPGAFLFIGLAVSLGVASPGQDRGHLGKITWELDPAAGLARAKAEKKAALLYFTADW
jgi:hypothetical protein